MEAGYGGPVWHASAASVKYGVEFLRHRVEEVLKGVGSAALGEWEGSGMGEGGMEILHIRRRLTANEDVAVGGLRDIRGMLEVLERAQEITGF